MSDDTLPPVGATVVDAVGVTYTLVADEYGNEAWEYGDDEVAHWSQEPILAALWRSGQARQADAERLARFEALAREAAGALGPPVKRGVMPGGGDGGYRHFRDICDRLAQEAKP